MAEQFDVIVIGAGVAGLAALQDLDRGGARVLLLEARNRIGGRIFTVHDPLSPLPLELGAEFIHGRPPELWDIIRRARLAIYDGTDTSRYMNAGVVEHNADSWDLVEQLLHEMRKAATGADQSFDDFLCFSNYDNAAQQAARGYIEGFNAADAHAISIQALAEETAAADQIDGDRVFRFAGGYDAVPLHLLESVSNYETKLRLGMAVKRVEWSDGFVSVSATNSLTGTASVFQAARAIITVPLGVLQSGSIAFSPEPSRVLEAARALRFGQVFRLVLRFREPFWERREELRDAGFILSREPVFPTWWTTLSMRSAIITGWSAGAKADQLIGLPREAIVDRALTSLARITAVTAEVIRSQLAAVYFHDWQQDEFACGAYSYVPVGALGARKQLGQPVKDTLYVAGEAANQGGHSATVHGAIESGRRAARLILSSPAAAADS